MDDLMEWLRAQLDEDERVARAATCEAWRVTTKSDRPYTEDGEIHTVAVHARWVGDKNPEPYQVVTNGDFHEAVERNDAEHIARHDPARVLREVEAKRLMLAELEQLPHYAWDGRDEYGCPKYIDSEAWRDLYGEGVEQVCNCGRDAHVERQRRLLALSLADRPGYRSEWRIDTPTDAT